MRKVIGGLVALVIGLALVLIAAPMAASAHTGDLKVSAVCNVQTGEYDLTATLTISQTGLTGSSMWRIGTSQFQGTPRNANGMDRGPLTSNGAETITLGTFSLPGTTTGYGPWVYAFTKWSNGYTKGSDGQLTTKLSGDCTVPVPPRPEPLSGEETRTTDVVCVEPKNGNMLVRTDYRIWTQGWVLIDNVWTLQEKEYGEWALRSVTEVESDGCAVAVKPEPRPFEDAGETFTCDAWTIWTKTGFYDLTLDTVNNVWVENAEPTVTEETSEQHPTNQDERIARGCEEYPPPLPLTPVVEKPDTLADTGLSPLESWTLVTALGMLVAGVMIVLYRRSQEK